MAGGEKWTKFNWQCIALWQERALGRNPQRRLHNRWDQGRDLEVATGVDETFLLTRTNIKMHGSNFEWKIYLFLKSTVFVANYSRNSFWKMINPSQQTLIKLPHNKGNNPQLEHISRVWGEFNPQSKLTVEHIKWAKFSDYYTNDLCHEFWNSHFVRWQCKLLPKSTKECLAHGINVRSRVVRQRGSGSKARGHEKRTEGENELNQQ